ESDGLRDAADVPARRCSRSSGRDQPGVQRAPVPGAAARDGPPHPWPAGVLLTVKGLRAVAPEIPAQRPRGRYIHCDYMASGVQDMLTTWIPLAEVPVALGGLAVRPGGHQDRPRRPRLLAGTEPGWATTCYRPGDVIIFHCLTSHAALPNTSRQLRLSADFR